MKKDDVLYVSRLLLGLIMGLVSGYLSTTISWILIILLGIIVYASTVPLSLRLVADDSKTQRRNAILNGMGTYAIFWITGWILFYNIIY